MTTYVNDSGTWREINNIYVHDGTSFTNKTIDNVYINSTTNGLTYVVEKFKNQPICGHVLLKEGERSEVATISADIL